jgi:hypothetical protein
MGKRTSDFVALAAILGGAGLGIGLTSLFARTAPVAQMDDVSVEVRFIKGLVGDASVAPTIYMRRRVRAHRPNWEPSLLRGEMEDLRRETEDLRRETREIDLRELYEALEEVEALEDLDLGRYLTLDIFQHDDDEDKRRRRRRRRPRQEAEVPDVQRNR